MRRQILLCEAAPRCLARVLVLAVVIAFLRSNVLQAEIIYEVIDLGTLGGDQSCAFSINDAGQIVGVAEKRWGLVRATLFDPTGAGNNINLNTLIDPASGWTLRYAYDINSFGWIVGQGINPQGEWHAFLLIPKQPCRYTLAGDLNDDCKVDFNDFAVMATNWLVDCWVEPTDPACVPK